MKLARFNEDANQEYLLSIDAQEQEILASIDNMDSKCAVILYTNDISFVQAVRQEEGADECLLNYNNDLGDCFEIKFPSPKIAEVKKAFLYFLHEDDRLFKEFNWDVFISHYDSADYTVAAEVLTILKEMDGDQRLVTARHIQPEWLKTLRRIVDLTIQHVNALARKRSQLVYKDDYGCIESSRWEKEVETFWPKVIVPATAGLPEIPSAFDDHLSIINAVLDHVVFETSGSVDAESLDPIEYERFCAKQLEEDGWCTRMTLASGDQGTDIVATKNGLSVAIQCKKYSNPVGNAAVQEIIAGKAFEGTQYAAVVTNSTYTPHAIQLAQKTNVFLLHHSDLEVLFERLHGESRRLV